MLNEDAVINLLCKHLAADSWKVVSTSGLRPEATRMNTLADNWTAAGSIAAGFGAIAAFLAIAATVLVYLSQSRANRASAIRQNLQFLHGQQAQVTRSIESGFLATIDRQIREFRERLGSTVEPSYLLDQLFRKGQASDHRSLFRASALESNLSSTMYIRMSDIWDGMNVKAFEFRGAFRIFSYVSLVLTGEARRLCAPENTTRILDIMAEHGARETLSKIDSLDELVNRLLSDQIELASYQLEYAENGIRQGCTFIGMLADKTLRLSDKELLKLASKNVDQLGFDELDNNPRQAIETSLGNLRPTLSKGDLTALRNVVDRWDPQPADTLPIRPLPPERSPSRSSG